MTCIQSIEEDPRFRASNLSDDDSVRSVPERGLEQIRESNLALMSIELGLG
jgi:hypothetical protein